MNDAQNIVDALLEGDDEKPKKKMPAWLAKIKGEDTGEEEEGSEKKDDSPAAPKSSGGGGGSKGGSSTTVSKTW
jgi:hypothetical protein